MIVKVTRKYNDTQLKKTVQVGEVFEVSDSRAVQLILAKVAVNATEKEIKKFQAQKPSEKTE